MMFWKLALAIAGLALFCFASAEAAPPAAGNGAPKHFLWQVTGPKGVVYLLGTIHVGKADFYPLPSIIEDSFKKADTLVEEIDISEPAETAHLQRRVIEDGSYPNADAITNHLSEATRSHLAAYVKKGGLPEPAIAHMRPWLVSMLVVQLELKRMGFDPANGWTYISSKKRGNHTSRSAHWRTQGRSSNCSTRCPRSCRTVCC